MRQGEKTCTTIQLTDDNIVLVRNIQDKILDTHS
jgi:hypothetical protein